MDNEKAISKIDDIIGKLKKHRDYIDARIDRISSIYVWCTQHERYVSVYDSTRYVYPLAALSDDRCYIPSDPLGVRSPIGRLSVYSFIQYVLTNISKREVLAKHIDDLDECLSIIKTNHISHFPPMCVIGDDWLIEAEHNRQL